MSRLLPALWLALVAGYSQAGELRPFITDSLAAIQAQYAGRPYLLVLWSIDCQHCTRELRMLGELTQTDRRFPLVVVSTDTPADANDIQAALKRHGLARLDTWVFADAVPERLRHAVDPAWHGELPRAYLCDAAHRCEARSGLIGAERLKRWRRDSSSTSNRE